jgi:UDP-GlcNAc:undecaprenyl-phosphate GlcNAc-1-phosphate transferase
VTILWLWTALASAAALIPTYTNRGNALVPIALAALALLLFTYFHPGIRGKDEEEAEDDAEALPPEPISLEDHRRLRDGSG